MCYNDSALSYTLETTPVTTPALLTSKIPLTQRTRKASRKALPKWPYPAEGHLTAHAGSGQWRKRFKGRDHYFGTIDQPALALERFKQEWPATETIGRAMPE